MVVNISLHRGLRRSLSALCTDVCQSCLQSENSALAYFRRNQILIVVSGLKIAPKVTENVAQVDRDRVGRVDRHETTEEPEETSCFYKGSVSLLVRPKSARLTAFDHFEVLIHGRTNQITGPVKIQPLTHIEALHFL